MFYCEECRKDRDWPKSITTSFGSCEICGETRICWDVASYLLPLPKVPDPKLTKSELKFLDILMSAWVRGWYAGRNGDLTDDGKRPDCTELVIKYPIPASAYETNIELTRQIKLLKSELSEVRPASDCYRRVCEILGIKNNILGYVQDRKDLQTDLINECEILISRARCILQSHQCADGHDSEVCCDRVYLKETITKVKEAISKLNRR